MILTIAALVMIAGVLMYALSANPKLVEIGRIMLGIGLLCVLINVGGALNIARSYRRNSMGATGIRATRLRGKMAQRAGAALTIRTHVQPIIKQPSPSCIALTWEHLGFWQRISTPSANLV